MSRSPEEVDQDVAAVREADEDEDVPLICTPGKGIALNGFNKSRGDGASRSPADPVDSPRWLASAKFDAPDFPCWVSLATAAVISLIERVRATSDTSPVHARLTR
jgi:hypothetical protein